MSSDPINSETSLRICNHMNKDHSQSLKAYAEYYGGIKGSKEVEMVQLSSKAMELMVDGEMISIDFDHELQDCSDAHNTLVAMIKSIPKS